MAKLWLAVGGRGWWPRNYCRSWLVVGGDGKIMAGSGWSYLVVVGLGRPHDLVMPIKNRCSFLHYIFKRNFTLNN